MVLNGNFCPTNCIAKCQRAANDDVLSVSADAIVLPNGLLGGLSDCSATWSASRPACCCRTALIRPGAVVAPAVLRQTLGVDNTSWTGRGVGVAVIDADLEPSSEFSGRVAAFYDFTNGQTRAKTGVTA